MDENKVNRLRRRIEKLRRAGSIKAAEMNRLASSVGREPHSRGKHPTWIHPDLPNATPLTIPDHSVELNRFTAGQILDQIESDLDHLEYRLKSGRGE